MARQEDRIRYEKDSRIYGADYRKTGPTLGVEDRKQAFVNYKIIKNLNRVYQSSQRAIRAHVKAINWPDTVGRRETWIVFSVNDPILCKWTSSAQYLSHRI